MDWKAIIAKGETKQLDFKGAMPWRKDAGREYLLPAIIAMANVRDGGSLLIGVKETATKSHELVGLTPEEDATFDPTPIGEYVNTFVEPDVHVHVEHHIVDGLRLVQIRVEEFATVPHICIKEGPRDKSDQSAKPKFTPGQVLIRSAACESRAVQSAEEMRELLNLALTKVREKFAQDVRRMFEFREAPPLPKSPDEVHASQVARWRRARVDWDARDLKGKAGWFEMSLLPANALPGAAPTDFVKLREVVNRASVAKYGDKFPTNNYEDTYQIDRAVCADEKIEAYGHLWQLHDSGAFFYVEQLYEDHATDANVPQGARFLWFERAVNRLATSGLFAARLYRELGYDDTITLRIAWHGMRERVLVFPNSWINRPFPYVCKQDQVTHEIATTALALESDVGAFVDAGIRHLVSLFNVQADRYDGIVRSQRERLFK